MSLFDQLSNADQDCACCNKVMAQYYDRYLKADAMPGAAGQCSGAGARPYLLARKKRSRQHDRQRR